VSGIRPKRFDSACAAPQKSGGQAAETVLPRDGIRGAKSLPLVHQLESASWNATANSPVERPRALQAARASIQKL
jgi:hypothetical protein